MPSKIKNESHLEEFKRCGLRGDKMLYTWSPDHGQGTRKYVLDMIYCKQFIHPKNDLFDRTFKRNEKLWYQNKIEDWYDCYFDFSKIDNKIFGGDEEYDLFEIDVDEDEMFGEWVHIQEDDGNSVFSSTYGMDNEYAHNDKVTILLDKTIGPKSIKLVNEVSSRIFNNKIHINFRK